MKLGDMIKKVNRSEENSTGAYLDEFCEVLGITDYIYGYDEFSERVKGYYLSKWLCTDSWVGTIVYYMDDEPIAVSVQSARKSDREYAFINEGIAEKVRAFILTLIGNTYPEISLLDMDEELGETYTVTYSSQLLTGLGFVDGNSCKVIKESNKITSKGITVEFGDGKVQDMDVKDFHIPYNIIN